MNNEHSKVLLAYNLTKSADLTEIGSQEKFVEMEDSLLRRGFEVSHVNLLNDVGRLIDALKIEQPDVVFNCVEDFHGHSLNEIPIAGIFDLLAVPYTGSDAHSLALRLDKHRAKMLLRAAGINTPDWQCYETPTKVIFGHSIPFPVIVKPSMEDASIGIDAESVVYDASALKLRIEYLYEKFRQPIIVEKFIDGREVNAAFLGDVDKIALPLSEIDYAALPEELPRILTYDSKWATDTTYYQSIGALCPAPFSHKQTANIWDMGLKAANLFRCRDYCRIDFRIDETGQPFIIEVNANPELAKDGGFYRAAHAHGLSYTDMLVTIVNYARTRGIV